MFLDLVVYKEHTNPKDREATVMSKCIRLRITPGTPNMNPDFSRVYYAECIMGRTEFRGAASLELLTEQLGFGTIFFDFGEDGPAITPQKFGRTSVQLDGISIQDNIKVPLGITAQHKLVIGTLQFRLEVLDS